VTLRAQEIGIRMALGAQIPHIKGLVIRQSMKLIAAGIGIGIPVSLVLSRFFSALLFGIAPADPLTMSAIMIIAVAVGWVAAYFPARRAARIGPVWTLRGD
jgi:ABC-type antimicrobial peptide transport system permease subunit